MQTRLSFPTRLRFRYLNFALSLSICAVALLAPATLSQQPTPPRFTLSQIEGLIAHGVPDSTMAAQIQKRGMAFTPNPAILESLRAKGAGSLTLTAIEARFPKGTQGTVAARAQLTLGSGFSRPSSVAVDGSGNVFVVDGCCEVKMILTEGANTTVSTLCTGGNVMAVAADGSGHILLVGPGVSGGGKEVVATQGCSVIKELPRKSGYATSVAVDGNGNIFLADNGIPRDGIVGGVREIPSGCDSTTCVKTLGGGFGQPSGVALDGSGNVFVADPENNAVKKIPSGCDSADCVKTLGGGFNRPFSVAVGRMGNVFVAEPFNNLVKEVPPGCASTSCVNVLGGGFNSPWSVAVDGRGNVFVADSGNNRVVELEVAGPNATQSIVTQPTVNGPSIAVTMQFIQDKLNERGQVTWVLSMSLVPGAIRHDTYLLVHSDVSADAATCTLRSTETNDETTVRSTDESTGTAPQRSRSVVTQSFSFKDIDTITIGSPADIWNSRFAKSGHPEKTATVEPVVFDVVASGAKPVVSFHDSITRGDNQALPVIDQTLTAARFTFRDEEMAIRVANAMRHAVELCGSGNKEPF